MQELKSYLNYTCNSSTLTQSNISLVGPQHYFWTTKVYYWHWN